MWKKALACLLTLLALCAGAAAEDTLTLPEKLQIIEEEAFLNATGLKHVSVPEGTLEIGARAFAGSSVRSISIPASVKAIAEDAFQGVSGLEVTGQEGSYAQEYCEKHSISFTPAGAEPQPYPESAHPYPDNADQTWTWTGRADTKLLRIQFNQAMVEHGCDWLYVYDGEGNLLRRYTGSLPSGCRMLIPGHSFSIRLVSDEGSNAYGFSIRNIEELTSFTETPLKITSVSAPASPSVASFSNANTWTVEAEGSFTPLSYQYRLMRADASGEKEYTLSEHFRTFQTEYLWEAGLYTMYVTVTDGLGRSVTQKTDPIVVQYAEPLSIASLTADVESAWAGETVCWQAAYENAVYPMTVEYVVSRDGAEVKRETKVIGPGQNEAKYSYVPAASGSHTLTVTATDAAGFTASYTSAALPVQGTATPVVTITADCETVIVGTPITWTVAMENDSSPRLYYYSVHQNGTRVFAGSQSTADGRMTVTWTPDAACDWTLGISF
ncbi:MAG: leucine-rich repeat protein, partial [Clostridia bacterium]|nr:leucine-rich repeat protein [Clostridia bacterium]